MATLRAVAENRFFLETRVAIPTKYKTVTSPFRSGILQHLSYDYGTVEDLFTLMIVASDNTATATIVDFIGLGYLNSFCQDAGMRDTYHRYGMPTVKGREHDVSEVTSTTANDTGLILDLMNSGAGYVSDEKVKSDACLKLGIPTKLCQRGIDFMKRSRKRTKILSLLPPEAIAAKKGGTGERGFMDAGIVYQSPATPLFILTVYTDHVPPTVLCKNGENEVARPGKAVVFELMGKLGLLAYEHSSQPSENKSLKEIKSTGKKCSPSS